MKLRLPGTGPRWPRPDFLARAPRRPAAAWAVLALGAVACVLALLDAWSAHEVLAGEQRELARWQEAAARRGLAVRRGAPPLAGTQERQRDAAALQAALRLQQRLAHPWDRLFAGIEGAAADGLQWQALEHDAERPELRLEGTAADLGAVLHVVETLTLHPAWSDVVLRTVGTAPAELRAAPGDGRSDPGAAPSRRQRFELAARLRPQAR